MTGIGELLAPLAILAEDEAVWPPIRLRARTYLTSRLPSLDLVTSVRAVVRRDDQVLVVRDPTSVHILPGGRREVGETLMQTLRREVLEETGWTIEDPQLLGLVHFRHLTPEPAEYRYPYPDFLHLVYAATAGRYDAQRREVDRYELESGFQPLSALATLPISQGERVFLQAMAARSIDGRAGATTT